MSAELFTQEVIKKSKQMIENLLNEGLDVDFKDKNGWTSLHFAAWKGHTDIARFFIDKGADVNATDKKGKTPLYWAAEMGYSGLEDLLRHYGGK